ncbi:MAG: hypothetical protein JXL84_08705 [Deltaproteobacteria bacterium]|nr:hypothetical protein [Deltaproteobacteria bacterium]
MFTFHIVRPYSIVPLHWDELAGLPKPVLTNYVETLPSDKIELLNKALRIALEIPD